MAARTGKKVGLVPHERPDERVDEISVRRNPPSWGPLVVSPVGAVSPRTSPRGRCPRASCRPRRVSTTEDRFSGRFGLASAASVGRSGLAEYTGRVVRRVAVLLLLAAKPVFAEDSPEDLVATLAPSQQAGLRPEDRKVEDRLVALGDVSLSALERALHIGLRGRESQALRDSGASRRWAAVRVLARIPSARSTDLLVRSLADTPDNLSMRLQTLHALDERALTPEQVLALLADHEPSVVLFALRRVGTVPQQSPYRTTIETLFDPDQARKQLRNEFGASTAAPDAHWEVRLASGSALGTDMTSELRRRAAETIEHLVAEVGTRVDGGPAEFISQLSRDEIEIVTDIGRLRAVGVRAKELILERSRHAEGDALTVLTIALLALGEADRLPAVVTTMTDSSSSSLRIVAVHEIRRAKDRRAIPALWRALEDPFKRATGECCRIGDGTVHPVRTIAADALIELGEDPKAVRSKAAK